MAIFVNNLGSIYYLQGQFAEVEPLYRRSLAIKEKILGPKHPSVAQSLNNLGVIYRAQAEPLHKRTLAIYEKVLGSAPPDVGTSLENYAFLLRKTQRNAEAEEMEARAKAIRNKHARENSTK